MYRQGDVLIIPATAAEVKRFNKQKTPKAISREGGRVILQHGEATGHAHAIKESGAALYEVPYLKSNNEERMLEVKGTAKVRHEEHATLTLDSGFYRVLRQREHDPVEQRQRYVYD